MLKEFQYHPEGTCCRLMTFVLDDDKIVDVQFVGGCHGNLQGIASLVKGMSCKDVIDRLQGIHCGNKLTSCPDQFSRALSEVISQKGTEG